MTTGDPTVDPQRAWLDASSDLDACVTALLSDLADDAGMTLSASSAALRRESR